jgi:hypothetical protein
MKGVLKLSSAKSAGSQPLSQAAALKNQEE